MNAILTENLDFVALAACSLCGMTAVSYWLWRRRAAASPLLLAWAAVALTLAVGYVQTNRAADAERDGLRSMVEGIAPTYALQLEQLGHADLTFDTSDDDPRYVRLIEWQKRLLAVNPHVADVYTLRRLPDGRFAFLVDSETDYDRDGHIRGEREQRTAIGEVFEDEDGSLAAAWQGEPFFSEQPVSDRWGTWVSATVPMRNADGNVEAICGVDYPAESWNAHVAVARRATLAGVAAIVAVIGAAGLVTSLLRAHVGELRLQIDERKRVAEALAKAKEQADAANRAKSAFLANMSHEIRTPMTAIMGFADLLQDETATPTERGEYIATIRRNGRHLLAVLSDILDLSKIEAGKMTIEQVPASPAAIVEEVASLMRVRAIERGLILETGCGEGDMPATVHTDPTRLRQILMNLVSNAVKFTARGGVTIRAGYDAARGELRFDVTDTGIGMPPEVIARLFDPFQQADNSTSRQFGGTGLGLTISRRLAGMLGGDITVMSEPERGSAFSVRIAAPVHAWEGKSAPMAAAPAPHAAERRLAGRRVLLVEDGKDNQRLIALHLTREGAMVRIVEHGKAAVDAMLAPGASFDLVLMDMQMPVLDGYAATRQIRAAGHRGPIVALTAHASGSDRQRCLDAGCDDYATKPIDREVLIATCRSAITSARRAA